ncbi:hypothetical protein RGQ29_002522 [Quercus rubra]|uniref:Tyrosine-protein kinase catalytic domain-containing protein n=1 Tax=Quercus rubra TaxID=3512 RepID=A0AAN7E9D7_QUERU|nr:hypothetical protein RGQ29_002522 [Quercus rubra]
MFTKMNFSIDNAIGMGKIGVMYIAILPNGSLLAVKRSHGCQSFEKQFISELLALGTLRHNNIVPLLGFCRERKEKLLTKEGTNKMLEWPSRIKIAIGIASGLAWLHRNSNSILLDKNFVPKISNFGGGKISSPEGMMFIDSNDTDSSNSSCVDNGVWEFGFVKKDGRNRFKSKKNSNNLNGSLVDWITHLLSSSDLYSVIDKSLIGRGFDGEIIQFLRIACTCLNFFPTQRPTMFQLYTTISTLGERNGITNDSELLRNTEIATTSVSNEIV